MQAPFGKCRTKASQGRGEMELLGDIEQATDSDSAVDTKRPYPRQAPCALVAPARGCAGGSGQPLSLPRPRVPLDQTRSFVRRTKAFDNRDRPTRASASGPGGPPSH